MRIVLFPQLLQQLLIFQSPTRKNNLLNMDLILFDLNYVFFLFNHITHMYRDWPLFIFVFLKKTLSRKLKPLKSKMVSQLKSNVVNILAKAAALRNNLNIDGAPTASRSHTHPSNSQTSRLLSSSLCLGLPFPRSTRAKTGRTQSLARVCEAFSASSFALLP